jgi:hypothetical protein
MQLKTQRNALRTRGLCLRMSEATQSGCAKSLTLQITSGSENERPAINFKFVRQLGHQTCRLGHFTQKLRACSPTYLEDFGANRVFSIHYVPSRGQTQWMQDCLSRGRRRLWLTSI